MSRFNVYSRSSNSPRRIEENHMKGPNFGRSPVSHATSRRQSHDEMIIPTMRNLTTTSPNTTINNEMMHVKKQYAVSDRERDRDIRDRDRSSRYRVTTMNQQQQQQQHEMNQDDCLPEEQQQQQHRHQQMMMDSGRNHIHRDDHHNQHPSYGSSSSSGGNNSHTQNEIRMKEAVVLMKMKIQNLIEENERLKFENKQLNYELSQLRQHTTPKLHKRIQELENLVEHLENNLRNIENHHQNRHNNTHLINSDDDEIKNKEELRPYSNLKYLRKNKFGEFSGKKSDVVDKECYTEPQASIFDERMSLVDQISSIPCAIRERLEDELRNKLMREFIKRERRLNAIDSDDEEQEGEEEEDDDVDDGEEEEDTDVVSLTEKSSHKMFCKDDFAEMSKCFSRRLKQNSSLRNQLTINHNHNHNHNNNNNQIEKKHLLEAGKQKHCFDTIGMKTMPNFINKFTQTDEIYKNLKDKDAKNKLLASQKKPLTVDSWTKMSDQEAFDLMFVYPRVRNVCIGVKPAQKDAFNMTMKVEMDDCLPDSQDIDVWLTKVNHPQAQQYRAYLEKLLHYLHVDKKEFLSCIIRLLVKETKDVKSIGIQIKWEMEEVKVEKEIVHTKKDVGSSDDCIDVRVIPNVTVVSIGILCQHKVCTQSTNTEKIFMLHKEIYVNFDENKSIEKNCFVEEKENKFVKQEKLNNNDETNQKNIICLNNENHRLSSNLNNESSCYSQPWFVDNKIQQMIQQQVKMALNHCQQTIPIVNEKMEDFTLKLAFNKGLNNKQNNVPNVKFNLLNRYVMDSPERKEKMNNKISFIPTLKNGKHIVNKTINYLSSSSSNNTNNKTNRKTGSFSKKLSQLIEDSSLFSDENKFENQPKVEISSKGELNLLLKTNEKLHLEKLSSRDLLDRVSSFHGKTSSLIPKAVHGKKMPPQTSQCKNSFEEKTLNNNNNSNNNKEVRFVNTQECNNSNNKKTKMIKKQVAPNGDNEWKTNYESSTSHSNNKSISMPSLMPPDVMHQQKEMGLFNTTDNSSLLFKPTPVTIVKRLSQSVSRVEEKINFLSRSENNKLNRNKISAIETKQSISQKINDDCHEDSETEVSIEDVIKSMNNCWTQQKQPTTSVVENEFLLNNIEDQQEICGQQQSNVLQINDDVTMDRFLYTPSPEFSSNCDTLNKWLRNSDSVNSEIIDSALESIQKKWFAACKSDENEIVKATKSILDWLRTNHKENVLMSILNMQDNCGNTMMHLAVAASNWKLIDVLLSLSGLDLKIKNRTGYMSFMLTSISKVSSAFDFDCLLRLMKMAVNIGAIDERADNSKSSTCLCLAAEQGHQVLVELLLSCGANVNISDGLGFTPLMHATANAHIDIVKVLLKMPQIDVDIKNQDGNNAWNIAMGLGYQDVALLIYMKAYFIKKSDGKGSKEIDIKNRIGFKSNKGKEKKMY